MTRRRAHNPLLNLGLGFAAVLALMLAVLSLGVSQMDETNRKFERVVAVNNVKTQLASRMRNVLRDRAIIMHDIVVSIDAWEKDRLFIQFLELGERYAKDRAAIEPLLDTPVEKTVLREIDTITSMNQPVMLRVIEQALEDNNYGALILLQEEAIPLQNQLVAALDRMTRLQSEANEAALHTTYRAYQETRRLILILGSVAALLALAVAIVVSRRLLAQTRQIETERTKYQTLFETNTDAVVILDGNRFTDCNPATLRLFGIDSVEAFLATPMGALGAPVQSHGKSAEIAALDAIQEAHRTGHAHLEWRGRKVDGSEFDSEIKLHAMQLEGRPVIQAIMRDVSRQRAAEAEREAARQASLNIARAKSAFVANVSHEIRTPMHGILGMAELLLKSPLDASQREKVLTLKKSAENLLAIINDILDFSKIEAGKLTLETIPFSPGELLRDLVVLNHSRAADKGIHLELIESGDACEALLGDPVRIRQILLNLVDNAIKFTDRGQVTLRAHYTVTGDAAKAVFEVRDTGIGVSEDVRQNLFQAFSQADSSTTRRYGGTGLGLAVSRQLAELMGGQITVESTPGLGSCFTLALTLPTAAPLPDAVHEPEPPHLSGHVLVVEDHPVNQTVLAGQLDALGITCDLAADGVEALEKLQTGAYDAVLMDWQMPRMDGLEALKHIRALPGDTGRVPVIALTANVSPAFRETCLAAGANGFLGKPYTEALLARVLSAHLDHAPHPPLLDRTRLDARYPGKTDFVNQLVELFHQTASASLAKLAAAQEAGDHETMRREAHALRGAAASVGAEALSHAAAKLESALASGENTHIQPALQALLKLGRSLHPAPSGSGTNT